MSDQANPSTAFLVVPRLRIQNANAISAPLTWGFPAMSAFVGLMHALERRLEAADIKLFFESVGVVCHDHEPLVSDDRPHRFRLTRNPVTRKGESAPIVEEGRMHLELTLAFEVYGEDSEHPETIQRVGEELATMRIAGGTTVPQHRDASEASPYVLPFDDERQMERQFSKLKYGSLPGFTLVSRQDLLERHFSELRETTPDISRLEAWLDLSRLNYSYQETHESEADGEWQLRRPPGWLVPIPVGYGALSELHAPGTIRSARDPNVAFRFVESLYSIGQWVSPHRLRLREDFFWYSRADTEAGHYLVCNDFRPPQSVEH